MNSLDERPSADVPLIPLTAKVTPSLTKQLETLGGDQQTNNNSNGERSKIDDSSVVDL